MLLDYELKKAGIDPFTIPGYEREVTTHIAVALAVKSGEADAGHVRLQCGKSTRAPVCPGGAGTLRACYPQGTCGRSPDSGTRKRDPVPEFKAILNHLGGYDTEETGILRSAE